MRLNLNFSQYLPLDSPFHQLLLHEGLQSNKKTGLLLSREEHPPELASAQSFSQLEIVQRPLVTEKKTNEMRYRRKLHRIKKISYSGLA